MMHTLPGAGEALALRKELEGRGFRLAADGAGVRVWPASRLTDEDQARIRGLRAHLLATLRQNGTNETNGTTARGEAAWDSARADAALAACDARLARALGQEANTVPRRSVIKACRTVVARHHASRDPLLWTDLAGVEAMLARWRAAHAGVAPPDEGDWWEAAAET